MDKSYLRPKSIMKYVLGIILIPMVLAAALAIGVLQSSFTGRATYVVPEDKEAMLEISYSPDSPKVLEKMEITVRTISGISGDFLLEAFVAQEGKVAEQRTYRFSADVQDTNEFAFEYSPSSIETQTAVANLYSSDKGILYDSKIIEFKAQSDVGPFDIEIDLPTNFVLKGDTLPVRVRMKNFGTKADDVNLVVTIYCYSKQNIEQTSFIYLTDSLEKSMILPTCGEAGQHRIKAAINLYGIEHVAATSQYFERESLSSLDFSTPDYITAEERTPRDLSIVYRNSGNTTLYNIRLIVFSLPSAWFTVKPSTIADIDAGESIVSVISFNVPDGSEGAYPILIGASGDNMFSGRLVEFNVIKPSHVLQEAPANILERPGPDTINLLVIAAMALSLVLGLLLMGRARRKSEFSHKLGRIREKVVD